MLSLVLFSDAPQLTSTEEFFIEIPLSVLYVDAAAQGLSVSSVTSIIGCAIR